MKEYAEVTRKTRCSRKSSVIMYFYSAALVALGLTALVEGQSGNYSGSRHLWYDSPGNSFTTGLAIGSGRIGALVFGSAAERIILNENSVWSGLYEDRINNASRAAVPEIRNLLENGNLTEAGQMVLEDMAANPTTNRMFSVTNDLVFDLGHSEDSWDGYERWLDTLNGNTGVSYTYNGVNYRFVLIWSSYCPSC
jgi:hypothetical protein